MRPATFFLDGVVFLDIDGVLNTDALIRQEGLDALDPQMVYRLDKIINATKAKIVVSSSWRVQDMPKALTKFRRLMSVAGFQNLEAIVDATPHVRQYQPDIDEFLDCERGHEIDLWMAMRGIPRSWSKFIVLDDNLIGRNHAAHLIRTQSEVGLADVDVKRAVSLFSRLVEAHAAVDVMSLVYAESYR
jgi:hypothetical protein